MKPNSKLPTLYTAGGLAIPTVPFLKVEVLDAAKEHDSQLPRENKLDRITGYITVLSKFGVVGFEWNLQYLNVKAFLIRHGIVHCSNERGVLWVPEFSPGIKALLGA